ncbi:hypothetical protein JM93_01842 [Roseibium hamelinense]|uniref:Probable membrane transporter protein n=1 Tax=Roseibium hamelinense TaxID=150831 RepID=A0A562T7N6_9HYPH|nr:sulfite exporter TauE/SafE family protein [Roseibium hamelinense]MTI43569.1 sulfite exporter TauE/SafE family protein [Roseibium hamelinense]TWI89637.1 hypothetical protein JM93_01842 [Roseibium hamelinense]
MSLIETAVLAACVFVFAGTVKGVVGFGLPTLALGLLVVFMGHQTAMTLILLPSLATNLVQAVYGGQLRLLLRRLWLFLLAAFFCVWVGASVLTGLGAGVSEILLGSLLVVYALPGLMGFQASIPPAKEHLIGGAAGGLNGVLTGLTGSFTVPGVFYLQSIGLPRDQLVQAMGVLFLVSTCALGISLSGVGRLEAGRLVLSGAMVVPTLAGQWLGIKIRSRLSEVVFRRLVLAVLLCLGLYLAALGLSSLTV